MIAPSYEYYDESGHHKSELLLRNQVIAFLALVMTIITYHSTWDLTTAFALAIITKIASSSDQ
jgi:hypothetical protein